jgi:hypothetical protein
MSTNLTAAGQNPRSTTQTRVQTRAIRRNFGLEETDRLDPGRREEELLVIRADKP